MNAENINQRTIEFFIRICYSVLVIVIIVAI